MSKALEVLKKVLPVIEQQSEIPGYGFFTGGDPRDFTPDSDASTAEEQAKWKADCEAYAKGEIGPQPTGDRWLTNAAGEVVGHLQLGGYGLGSYIWRDRDMQSLAAEVREAIDGMTGT